MIFHIAKKTDWEQAQKTGHYTGPTLKTEGFIHCSHATQLVAAANRLFKGQQDLVLLAIDRQKVKAEIREENLESGSELYPHIYGQLATSAVLRVFPFQPNAEGFFDLPSTQYQSSGNRKTA